MLTFEQICDLVDRVARHRLRGVTVDREGFRLEINGYEQTPAPVLLAPAAVAAPAAVVTPGSAPPAPAAAAVEAPSTAAAAGTHIVTAPIVGTFYSAPSPDSEAFVRVGGRVRKGQVLCIVEAMKLMNEIESDVEGTVVEVFPRNGQPVEYGENLFAIRED